MLFWRWKLYKRICTNRLSLPLRTLLLLSCTDIVPHLKVQFRSNKCKNMFLLIKNSRLWTSRGFLTIGSEPSEQVGVDSSTQGGRLEILFIFIAIACQARYYLDKNCYFTLYPPVLSCGVVVGLVPIGAVGKGQVVAEVTSGCCKCKQASKDYKLPGHIWNGKKGK